MKTRIHCVFLWTPAVLRRIFMHCLSYRISHNIWMSLRFFQRAPPGAQTAPTGQAAGWCWGILPHKYVLYAALIHNSHSLAAALQLIPFRADQLFISSAASRLICFNCSSNSDGFSADTQSVQFSSHPSLSVTQHGFSLRKWDRKQESRKSNKSAKSTQNINWNTTRE